LHMPNARKIAARLREAKDPTTRCIAFGSECSTHAGQFFIDFAVNAVCSDRCPKCEFIKTHRCDCHISRARGPAEVTDTEGADLAALRKEVAALLGTADVSSSGYAALVNAYTQADTGGTIDTAAALTTLRDLARLAQKEPS